MLKRLSNKLSEYPGIYTFLRKVIEANFKSQRKIIANELPKHGLVLDIPCGVGEFSVFFDKENYTGVDLSEAYVNYGKEKYGKNMVVGDALNLDFGDEYFDSVLVSGFFHHLSEEETGKVIDEVHRVLKKNGVFLLIEDAPAKNFISKRLQKYDVGANIRNGNEYLSMLKSKFNVEKFYPMKSGLWFYSVFVLKKKDLKV
ncbi:MAG: class I SAM-dependent methyltransferase [Candidatus Woesearchaeota archaeon]